MIINIKNCKVCGRGHYGLWPDEENNVICPIEDKKITPDGNPISDTKNIKQKTNKATQQEKNALQNKSV